MIHFGIRIRNCAIQTFQVFELLICAVDQPNRFYPAIRQSAFGLLRFLLTSTSTAAPAALAFSDGKKLATKGEDAQSCYTACTASSQCQETAAAVVDFFDYPLFSRSLNFWGYRAIKQRNST